MNENVRFGLIVLFLVVAGAVLFSVLLADSQNNQDVVESLPALNSPTETPEIITEPIQTSRAHKPRVASTPTPIEDESIDPVTPVVARTSNMPTTGTGRIYGTIESTEGGPIVYPVEVRLIRIPKNPAVNSKDDALVESLTIEQGVSYEFNDLPLGIYMLLAISPSHTGNTSTTLTPERKVQERTMSMYPGGVISGLVVDPNGEPVPDAQLFVAAYLSGGTTINANASRSLASKTVTDENGLFIMPGLQIRSGVALEYQLLTKAESYANDLTDLIPVGTTSVVIQLKEWQRASGHVLMAETDEPVADIRVFVTSKMALDVVQARTDNEGYFELSGLKSGEQHAHIDNPEFVVDPLTAKFEIPDGRDVENIEIRALTGGRISGRVFNAENLAGISGASVSSYQQISPGNQNKETALTNTSGEFTIGGLETGAYEIRLEKVEGFPDDMRRSGRQLVSVKAGQELNDMDFALTQGLTVSGIVVDQSGKPLETAAVNANSSNNNKYDYDRTDAQGRFTVAGFGEGEIINLGASKSGFGTVKQSTERLPNGSISGIKFVLGPESSISGIVVNKDGTPKGGQEMLAVPDDNKGSGNRIHRTGGDGKFDIDQLAPGTYHLHFYNNSWNRNGTPAATITLGAGEKKEGLRLLYELPDGFIIAGKLINEKGQPVGYASVQANGPGWGNTQSDAAGKFSINVKSDGNYGLTITHGSHSLISVRDIPAGTENLEIIMKGRGSISGKVLHAQTREPIQSFSIHRRRNGESFNPYMNSQFKMYHDNEGRFELTDAEEGDNVIIARAEGFAETELLISNVVPGASVDNIEMVLAPGVSMTGTIMNANREPISGAMLFHGPAPSYNQEQATRNRSGTDGTFTLDSLPLGSFEISVTHPSYANKTATVNLRAGGGNRHDFVLTNGGTLEGYVTYNKVAVTNNRISIRYPSSTGRGFNKSAQTDNKGYFQFSGLPDGVASVNPSISLPNGTRRNKNAQAEIADGLVTRLDFDFTPGTASIEGYVYREEGTPATGLHVNIQVETPSGNEGSGIETDANGYYFIGDLPAGNVNLNIYNTSPRKNLRFSLRNGEALQKDILLYGGTTVECTIQNATNQELQMQVLALPGSQSIDTDLPYDEFTKIFQNMSGFASIADNKGEIKGLEPGTYTIVAIGFSSSNPDPATIMDTIQIATQIITINQEKSVAVNLSF